MQMVQAKWAVAAVLLCIWGCDSCHWPPASSLEESLRDVRARAHKEAAERAKIPIPRAQPPQMAIDPLYFAALMGQEEIIKLFSISQQDLDVNKQRWFGETLLHAAIEGRNFKVIEVLLARGADPAIKNQKGDTGLHAAARSGSLPVLVQILEKLPPPKKKQLLTTPNAFGETPLHLAVRSGMSDIINLLLQHGSVVTFHVINGGTVWHKAAEEGMVSSLRALAAWDKTYVDVRNHHGHTPLHVAAAGGKVEAVAHLKSLGADVQSRGPLGNTALHLACNNKQLAAASTLLQSGADPNVQNNDGQTPLHVAAQHGWVDLVTLLLQRQADPNVKDIHGNTPLDLAQKFHHKKTAAALHQASSDNAAKGSSP
ncbi:MAG: ankyrin repeat domain-containing protein [Myxococcota bacterium]